jgi:hypothetical protein
VSSWRRGLIPFLSPPRPGASDIIQGVGFSEVLPRLVAPGAKSRRKCVTKACSKHAAAPVVPAPPRLRALLGPGSRGPAPITSPVRCSATATPRSPDARHLCLPLPAECGRPIGKVGRPLLAVPPFMPLPGIPPAWRRQVGGDVQAPGTRAGRQASWLGVFAEAAPWSVGGRLQSSECSVVRRAVAPNPPAVLPRPGRRAERAASLPPETDDCTCRARRYR